MGSKIKVLRKSAKKEDKIGFQIVEKNCKNIPVDSYLTVVVAAVVAVVVVVELVVAAAVFVVAAAVVAAEFVVVGALSTAFVQG